MEKIKHCPSLYTRYIYIYIYIYGKNQTLSQPIKGEINRLLKILFNSIYKFLEENNLLWSRLRPSDSCEYQLLSIVHDIYTSFDCSAPLDVRGIYLFGYI